MIYRILSTKEFETLLILLAPIAPHMTEELWHLQGNKGSIHLLNWAKFDSEKIKKDIKIAIQINGRVRAILEVVDKLNEKEVLEKALEIPDIKKKLEGKTLKKHIYVENRVLNIISS